MLNICRLCSKNIENDSRSVHIFGENGHESNLPDILIQHYGIEIHADHGAARLCYKCWQITDEFHVLYEIVQNAYAKLCSYSFDEPADDSSTFNNIADAVSPLNLLPEVKPPLLPDEEGSHKFELELEVKDEPSDDDVKPIVDIDLELIQRSSPALKRKPGRPAVSTKAGKSAKTGKRFKEDQQIRDFFKMSCDLCKINFQTMREALRHYRLSHNQAGYLVCCEKKFFRRCLALEHIRLHTNPNFLQCDKCNKSYSTKFALKNHLLSHDPIPGKAFTCHVCAASFAKKYQLSQHLRVRHIDQNNKPFGCDICGKFFVTKNVLSSHMKGVHENVNGQMCHICARTFKSKKVHDLHQLEHLDHELPKLQCNLCGAWLKHDDSLRKHLARHTEKEMMCKLCNKMYPSKTALSNHVRYVHSERIHRCTFCDKGFKKPVGLKEHMALHTGIDLYSCPYCPRTFKSGANMHSHRKKEHFEMWVQDRQLRMSSNVPQPSVELVIEKVPSD